MARAGSLAALRRRLTGLYSAMDRRATLRMEADPNADHRELARDPKIVSLAQAVRRTEDLIGRRQLRGLAGGRGNARSWRKGNPRPRPWTDYKRRIRSTATVMDLARQLRGAKRATHLISRSERLAKRYKGLGEALVRREKVGTDLYRRGQRDRSDAVYRRAEQLARARQRLRRLVSRVGNPPSRARLLERLEKLHQAVSRNVGRRKPPSKRQIAIEMAYQRTLRALEYAKRANPAGGQMARRKKKNPWLLRGPGGRFSKAGTPAWVRKRRPKRKGKAFKGPRRLGKMPAGLRKYWAKRLARARRPSAKETAYRKRARGRYRSHKAYLDRTRTFDAILGATPSRRTKKKRSRSTGAGSSPVLWSAMLQGPGYRPRGPHRPRQLTLPGTAAPRARRRNPRKRKGRGMPPALKRYWAKKRRSSGKRRRRNPHALIVNPRRKRRSSMARKRRRHHVRRRRNPGLIVDTIKSALPAAATGAAIGALDAKVLAGRPAIVGVLAKVGIGIGAALALKKKPALARSVADGAFATLGYQAGIKMLGGVLGGAAKDVTQGVAELVAEDEEAMGVLATELQGMGVLQIGSPAAQEAAALFEGTEPLEFEGGDEGWG